MNGVIFTEKINMKIQKQIVCVCPVPAKRVENCVKYVVCVVCDGGRITYFILFCRKTVVNLVRAIDGFLLGNDDKMIILYTIL